MRKISLILLILTFLLTGCSSKEKSMIENSLEQKYNKDFVVENVYKENNNKYASVKLDNIYFRTMYDKDYNITSDSYSDCLKDILLKNELAQHLTEDYIIYCQYNINNSNKCDVFVFTDYLLPIEDFMGKIVSSDLVSSEIIELRTGSVPSINELYEVENIINKGLSKHGIITKDTEYKLNEVLSDYQITMYSKD